VIVIEKQGQVVRIANLSPNHTTPPKPSKRGKVQEFSRKSRRRLIDLFARLDTAQHRKVFVTLTFAFPVPPSWAKRSLKRFLARVRYHYPQVSGVWRVEMQKRGAPHFHLMLLDLPYVEQALLQSVWTECTGEARSIAHITLIRSHRGVMSYVSKYIAKVETKEIDASLDNAPYQQNLEPHWEGRHWGVINEDCLPFAPRSVGVIVDEEVAGYFWWCASVYFSRKKVTRASTSRVYSSESQRIYEHALSLGGVVVDDLWHEMLAFKQLAPKQRTRASYFFAGLNTHH
jgi:hypothetical protein